MERGLEWWDKIYGCVYVCACVCFGFDPLQRNHILIFSLEKKGAGLKNCGFFQRIDGNHMNHCV